MKMECNMKEKMELLIRYMECKGGGDTRQKELLWEIVVELRESGNEEIDVETRESGNEEIDVETRESRNEELVDKIYLYGSMIRGKDRLERYIFLMLLRMAGALELGEMAEEQALLEALEPSHPEEKGEPGE